MSKLPGLLLAVLLLPTWLWAQETDTTTLKLAEVVVAGKRIQLPYAEQSRNLVLVDKQAIARAPVVSVADMLHYVSGVDVRTRGANGVQADVGIRGGTFDQTLILVNGIKISDPQTGHHSLNLPVDLRNIDRIEVLKGPAARIYGQNAFAGAVNIVTASPAASFLNVGTQAGDFGLWGVKASGAVVAGKQSHYMAINYDQSAGYKYNTDYTIFNAFYNGQVKVGQGEVNVLAGFTDRAFGANGFYASPEYTEQYESIQTGVAAIGYKQFLGEVSLEARLYYRQNDDEYIFIRNDPEFYKNNHTNKTFGLEINTVIPHQNATTGLGVDINQVTLNSNNLGDRQRFVTSLFVEHRMEFFANRVNITPGAQLNYYSDFKFNFLPGIDLGYVVTGNLVTFANIGYTYRVPTFTDMYYSDPVNLGNPDLLPEFAWNYEIGVKTINNRVFTGQASLFYRDGRNMIDWVRATDTDPWQPVNILSLTMAGLDSDAALNLAAMVAGKNPLLQTLAVNYTYINATAGNPDTGQSRYALENLRHQLRLNLTLAYGSKVTHTFSAGYYNRVNLDDYTTVDSRLSYQGKRLQLFADVTNIFDVTYQETNLVVMPGRWFKAGLSLKVF